MFSLALVISTLLSASHPVKAAAKDIQFIGFSRNDAVCAWRVTTHHHQLNGDVDSYSLVRIVNTRDNHLVATLRDSAISRSNAAGHKKFVSERELAHDNPDYADAGARDMWPKLKKQGHFTFVQVSFKSTLVRLLPDEDSKLSMKADDKKYLHVSGKEPNQALGYVPVARLFEGQMMPLGHYRLEGHSDTPLRADLKIFHSHSGQVIAVLNTFYLPEAPTHTQTDAAVLRTSPDDPIANTDMGMMEMVEAQAHSAEMQFKELHPSEAKDYDMYVGRWF